MYRRLRLCSAAFVLGLAFSLNVTAVPAATHGRGTMTAGSERERFIQAPLPRTPERRHPGETHIEERFTGRREIAIDSITLHEVTAERLQVQRGQARNEAGPDGWGADWVRVAVAAAALFGALVAASAFLAFAILFVYIGQFIAMARQEQYLRDGLAETRRIAEAASKSANIAEATLQMTQRAQLAVIYFEFGPHNMARSPTAILQVHNSGRLPAGIVGRTVSFVRGEQLPTDPADSPTEWVETGAVAAPGRAVQIIAPFHNVSLSHADWRDIVTGSLPLSVYGAIRYETGFPGVYGETGFAFTYDPDVVNVPENRRFAIANESGYNYSK
jgi:hypothetical protein